MGNGGTPGLPHVTEIQQRGNNTISVYIQTDSFMPNQEVEVSAYLTQGNFSAFYNDKKRIPLDPDKVGQPALLHVELPATETELDNTQPVTVVTRVTEIWSTVVPQNEGALKEYRAILGEYRDQEIKGVWKFPDPAGKEQGDTGSPSTGNGASEFVKTPQP
jgi:hypothetical protein